MKKNLISVKNGFAFFILLVLAIHGYPKMSVDSLRQVLKTAPSAREKSMLYQQMAQYWVREQQQDSTIRQIDLMLHYAGKEKGNLLSEQLIMANKLLMATGSFDHAEQINDKYLIYFKEKKDQMGIATCDYNQGRIQLFTGRIDEAMQLLSQAYELSEKNNTLRPIISIDLGAVYNRQGRYPEALSVLTNALDIIDSVKASEDYCGLLFTVGNTYGQINDHKTALEYYQKVQSLSKRAGNIMGEANAWVNIASAHNNLGEYDLAEKDARKALHIVQGKNLMAEAEVLSILTGVLLKKEKYGELDNLYQRMYALGDITGNTFYPLLADIGKAHLAYAGDDYHRTIILLSRTLPRLEEQGDWSETVQGYKLLTQSYEKIHDYKNALNAATKYYTYRDSTYNQDKIKELALLQSKLAFQKKELVHEKEKRTRDVALTFLALIFCIGVVSASIIFNNRQKINKQKQQLLSSQLEIVEHNLKIAELKLNDFTQRIQEKTKLANEVQQQLALHIQNDNDAILQLQRYTILTEEDWQDFKSLFEQVHSGFLYRLKEKYPIISTAETRYLSLAKLHLSTKEMAAVLGVSTQSIRTNWYRIRKKLDLPEETTVEELVAKV